MKIALCIVSALFAGLSMLAALSQLGKVKDKPPLIVMAVGGLLLLAAAVCGFMSWQSDVLLAVLGCMMICAAAIWTGKKSGNFHIQHHIIRIVLSVILVLGFVFF